MSEKITVITIVRNDVKNIYKTLLSVVQQTYSNIEYIIKDGNSSDGTLQCIKTVIGEHCDSKTKLIISEDFGIYDAMNQALSYATGDWVIFMNSGDEFFDKNVISKIFHNSKTQYGLICGDTVTKCGNQYGFWKSNVKDAYNKMPCSHQSCFMKRDFLVRHSFDPQLKICADYDCLLSIIDSGAEVFEYDGIVSIYGLDGVSSLKFIERYKDYLEVKRRHGCTSEKYIVLKGYLMAYIKTITYIFLPQKILDRAKKIYTRKKYGIYDFELK